MPKSMLDKLDMVAQVDELTRGEVIRMALREYLDELDLKWYKKEIDEMREDENEESESEELEGDEEDEE